MNGTMELPTFGWSEVNCFLRPQYLACEGLAAGHGALFLFLASQQRAHALRPALPDALRHGADSHVMFCDLTGIDFGVTCPPSVADVLASVKRALDDGPVIVPLAPGYLDAPPAAGMGRELHHVALHAFERHKAAFVALDNVAFHRDQNSVAYEHVSIAEASLERAIQEAWSASPSGKEKGGCWILQIGRGRGFVERSPAAVGRLMLAEYRRLALPRSPDDLLPIEELHLTALREAAPIGGEGVARLVREYLSDCNLCGVHLRLAAYACEYLTGEVDAGLRSLVERTIARARSTRSHSLVNCLCSSMTEQDWASLRARLVDIMGALQQRLATAAASLL